jgi:hypothetical protein
VIFLHSNTIYDVQNLTITGTSLEGISHGGSGNFTVRTTAVLNIKDTGGPQLCFNGAFAAGSTNNVSSDGTAPGGASSPKNMANYTAYFVSIVTGAEDLHLRNDSITLWGADGVDLSANGNLPVVDDVDGQARAALPDIGATSSARPCRACGQAASTRAPHRQQVRLRGLPARCRVREEGRTPCGPRRRPERRAAHVSMVGTTRVADKRRRCHYLQQDPTDATASPWATMWP